MTPTYEPHHDVITQGDQVQIYEMVMGDVNGDVTTVLERAEGPDQGQPPGAAGLQRPRTTRTIPP